MKLKILFPLLILSLLLDTAFSAALSDERIYGGHLINITDAPHSAQVMASKCENGKCFTISCGGSILRRNLILTAGHCVLDGKQLYRPQNFDVFVGSNLPMSGVRHKVKSVYIHPRYTDQNIHNHHDVAILQLVGKIDLNESSQLVHLALSNDRAAVGTRCYVCGWGKNPEHKKDKRLYRVYLNIVSSSKCALAFGDPNFDKHEICAYAPNKSSCQGDSGSAFIDTETNRQVGLVSYGTKDCTKPVPSAYCKITDNLDFINNIISVASDRASHCRTKLMFSES